MNKDREQIKSLSSVDHPLHYGGKDNPCETIKVIESLEMLDSFCIGNAIKYLMRAGKKNRDTLIEDLKKARWYIDYFIESLDTEDDLNIEDQLLKAEKEEKDISNYIYKVSDHYPYPNG
jgi:hypothetical protein